MIIEIEGITGSGKTTMLPHAKECIESLGYKVITLKEPGDTHLGMQIRNIIQEESHSLDTFTQKMLFLANRADIFAKKVMPHLEWVGMRRRSPIKVLRIKPKNVLLFDRFFGSTFVYQCCMSNLIDEKVIEGNKGCLMEFHKNMGSGKMAPGFFPNLSLILSISPETALKRCGERYHKDGREIMRYSGNTSFLEYNQNAHDVFKKYCGLGEFSWPRVRIDAEHSIVGVTRRITNELKFFLPTLARTSASS